MPRRFFTQRDVDELADGGCTELVVDDATTLTDLARERARERGIALVSAPTGGDPVRTSVRAAVIARLGGEPPGLDAVIDRVIDELP